MLPRGRRGSAGRTRFGGPRAEDRARRDSSGSDGSTAVRELTSARTGAAEALRRPTYALGRCRVVGPGRPAHDAPARAESGRAFPKPTWARPAGVCASVARSPSRVASRHSAPWIGELAGEVEAGPGATTRVAGDGREGAGVEWPRVREPRVVLGVSLRSERADGTGVGGGRDGGRAGRHRARAYRPGGARGLDAFPRRRSLRREGGEAGRDCLGRQEGAGRAAGGCLVIDAARERRRRTSLQQARGTVPDPAGTPIAGATARWVFGSLLGAHQRFLATGAPSVLAMNLGDGVEALAAKPWNVLGPTYAEASSSNPTAGVAESREPTRTRADRSERMRRAPPKPPSVRLAACAEMDASLPFAAAWTDVGDALAPRATGLRRAASSVTCNKKGAAMPTPVSRRVKKRRDALRAAGLRPVQIWVPDTRRPGFEAECRRQAALVAQSDRADDTLSDFMDAALVDVDGLE